MFLIALLAGCGGADPNRDVADRLVSYGLIDLNEVCRQAMVDGRQQVEEEVIRGIYRGAGRTYADSHVFTNGATPDGVASTLLARCLPDGTWR